MKRIIMLCLLAAAAMAHAGFDAIHTLTPEQGQEVRRALEAQLLGNPKADPAAAELQLLTVFMDPATTLEGKKYACRLLRFCASEASIPVLAKALRDPELSHYARFALQGVDSPKVDKALLAELPGASDAVKVGIVGSLGQRGTEDAVNPIAACLAGANTDLQRAAITALGNIGGEEAVKALVKAKIHPDLERDRKLATLKAADGLPGGATAAKAYMYDKDAQIRAAALIAYAKAAPQDAAPVVFEKLGADNPRERAAAMGSLPALRTAELTASGLDASKPVEVLIINELARRHATEAEGVVAAKRNDPNKAVAEAAWTALGDLGGAESLPLLIEGAPSSAAAFGSLCRLNTQGADEALIEAVKTTADDKAQALYIDALVARRTKAALPLFAELAAGDWSRVSAEAIDGLSALVDESDFGIYAKLLLAADNEKKVKALEKSMRVAIRHQAHPDACVKLVAAAYPKAAGEARYGLIRALGGMGGAAADRVLSEALASDDPKAVDAAARGLSTSSNPAVADDLLKIAKTSKNTTHQVIALRGYIRLAGEIEDDKRALAMCREAIQATDRPAELKSVIARAKQIRSNDAVKLVASLLSQPELVDDCGWALIQQSNVPRTRQAAVAPLKRVVELTKDERLQRAAEKRLAALGAK